MHWFRTYLQIQLGTIFYWGSICRKYELIIFFIWTLFSRFARQKESFHYNSSSFDTHHLRTGWFDSILLLSMWNEHIQNFRSISQTVLDLEQFEICQISLPDITQICDQFEHFYLMRSSFFVYHHKNMKSSILFI